MSEFDRDLPTLVDVGDMSLHHPSFHESSTNISLADSAAATLGSESVQEMSDPGLASNVASSSNSDESDGGSFYGSASESNLKIQEQFQDIDMSTDDDWVEENSGEGMQKMKCLFCNENLSSVHLLLEHCNKVHHFQLGPLKKRHGMDQYSFIRLINFIRSCTPTPREVMELDLPIWEQDKFMMPAIEDDPLLMYDFDDEIGEKVSAKAGDDSESTTSNQAEEDKDSMSKSSLKFPFIGGGVHVANAEGGHVTLTQTHFDELHTALQRMQLVVDENQAALRRCQKDMQSMRKTMRNLVTGGKESREQEEKAPVMSCDDNEDDEECYFSSYAHFGIHHEMLADKPRTESYRDAILGNASQIAGKTVLDLGCGTGILSMFAVQAGASKVIGVDQSHIIFNAMAIIRENQMEEKIKLIRGRIEDVNLNEPRIDVLISEWMGYFLLFEGMLDSVIHARNKYLTPDGLILPNGCSIQMMAVADPGRHDEVIGFWNNVYGLKMTAMKPEVLREAFIETVPVDKIISEPAVVLNLDLKTCHVQETEFFTAFKLTATRDDQMTALVGSFDVTFHLEKSVSLSTSPYDPPTHWKQTVFYLPEPVSVRQGQVLDCSIQVQRHRKGSRWLEVTLILNGEKLKYTLS